MTTTANAEPITAAIIQEAMGLAQRGQLLEAAKAGERGIARGGELLALSAMAGMFYARAGEIGRAVPHLRAANRGRPDDVTIAGNLIAALIETGDLEGALDVCTVELASRDATLKLLRMRGFLSQELEDFVAAVDAYRRVVAAAPSDWESWNNLGNALAATDDHQESVAALQRALEINADSAPTRLNLALQLAAVGREQEAVAILRESIARDPADKPAITELAGVLRKQGPSDEVVDLFARASRLDASDAAVLVQYGVEARAVDRFGEAEHAFRSAVLADPAHELGNLNLADFLDQMNRENEIAAVVLAAEEAGAPKGTLSFMRALDLRRARAFEEGLAALAEVPDAIEMPRCQHLRGQFLDGLGRYDQAFEAFEAMNALNLKDASDPQRRAETYRNAVRAEFETVTPEWFSSWRPEAPSYLGLTPTFLVGFPRSGTTLLDTILLSHPKVEILEEEPALRDANALLPDINQLPFVGKEEVDAARAKYFEIAAKLTPLAPGTLLIDKNPLHMNKLPFIRRLFPQAKIILAVRHPCDVLLSCFITNFSLNAGMANFLRLDTAAELYDLSFSFVQRAIEVMRPSVHTVIYENIVADRARELKSLFEFLELDWTDQVLDHQTTARSRTHIKTASYSQVVEPIYTRAAGRWERYRDHLTPILPILKPWVEKFGYSE